MGPLATIKDDVHASTFLVNDFHVAVATCLADMHTAIGMRGKPEIQRKLVDARRRSDPESEVGDDARDGDVREQKQTPKTFDSSASSSGDKGPDDASEEGCRDPV